MKLFGGLSYEQIRRYSNSPPYAMARWPPQQIPRLNFLGHNRKPLFKPVLTWWRLYFIPVGDKHDIDIAFLHTCWQWHNPRLPRWAEDSALTSGGGGWQSAPQRLLTGKFLLMYQEKRGKEKGKRGENLEEKKENGKREGGKLEMEVGKVIKRGEDLFLFFFFLLFTFENDRNLFWVYLNGNFLQEKTIHAGKKSGKMTLPPQKNMPATPLAEDHIEEENGWKMRENIGEWESSYAPACWCVVME